MCSAATTNLARAKTTLEPYEITLVILYTVGKWKDSSIYNNIQEKLSKIEKMALIW